MLELWLVCPGETPWNREGRALGQSDPPLSELGVRQAELLAQRLAGVNFTQVFSSDLARARYTARLCLPAAEIRLEPRLREVNFGRWEGQRWQDMRGEEKKTLDLWRQDPYRAQAPGGESYEAVRSRVAAWLLELPQDGRVVAFAHGGSIRSALYHFTGFPEHSGWRFQIDTGSVTRVLLGPQGAVLQAINDTALLV